MKRAAAAFGVFLTATAAVAGSGRHERFGRQEKSIGKPSDRGADQNPDGAWRIESTTTVGSCDVPIPASLTIADRKIADAPGAAATVWGYVDEAGQIVARFTGSGGRVVRLHGQLGGASGTGAWSSSTDMCGGIWRARRG